MERLPGGIVGPDPGTLSPEQLEQLRDFKIQTRIANEKYLRTHKEVSLLISGFFSVSQISPAVFWKLYPVLFEEEGGLDEGSLPVSSVPEVSAPDVQALLREMFLKRPENILEFAAYYFTDPRLPNKIHMQLIKDKKGD